jgi:Zn-dependent metalloprotease
MKTSFTCILCFAVLISVAQEKQIKLRKNPKGVLEYVKFSSSSAMYDSTIEKQMPVPASATVFFKEYLKTSPSVNFVKQSRRQLNKEISHERYHQYYKGLKVEGACYTFHFRKGRMCLAHGNYIDIGELNTMPSISAEDAKKVFVNYKEIDPKTVASFKSDLLVKEVADESGIDTIYMVALAYRVSLSSDDANNNEIGYVDAHSGKVLTTVPRLIGYSATGTFATRYSGSKQASTQYYNNNFNLCDSTRGAVIRTLNLGGSTIISNAVELTDNDNNWTAVEHSPDENDMGLDIHWALQEIYDYFNSSHGVSSFDGNGHEIIGYFHYGTDQFDKDNAWWDPVDSVLLFGNGASRFTPVASLDAVAHEYGHGLTHFQIEWEYTGTRAAFHEGLSDIWGVILENRISPNSIWVIGEEIIVNDDCLRNIGVPGDPNADTQMADTYLSPVYNLGDQYIKSGVFSHWFYLLANGGTGTNANGDTYRVYGIGLDAAEDLIAEAVFGGFLSNEVDTYPELRTAIASTADNSIVFGSNTFHTLQVQAAWHAVGVGTEPTQATISGPNLVCNSGANFTVPPSGSTINWTTSSNLRVYSGQGTTSPIIKPKYSSSTGNGWVRVNYTSNGYTVAGPKMDVGVGVPSPGYIDYYNLGPNYPNSMVLCDDMPNDGKVRYLGIGNILEYSWSIYDDCNNNWQVVQHPMDPFPVVPMLDVQFSKPYGSVCGWVNIIVKARNQCGWGVYKEPAVQFSTAPCGGGGGWLLMMAPNPANETLTVTLQPVEDAATISSYRTTSAALDTEDNPKYEIQIWHELNGLVLKRRNCTAETQLDVSRLTPGVYYIHAILKDEVIKEKVIIK